MWWLFVIVIIVFAVAFGVIYWYKSRSKKNETATSNILNNEDDVQAIENIIFDDLKILNSKKFYVLETISTGMKIFTYKNDFINGINELTKTLGTDSIIFEIFFESIYHISLYSLKEKLVKCFWSYSLNKKNNAIESIESHYDKKTENYLIYLTIKQSPDIVFIFQDKSIDLIIAVIDFLEVELNTKKINKILNDKNNHALSMISMDFILKNNFCDSVAFTDNFKDKEDELNEEDEFDEAYDENYYDNEFIVNTKRDYYSILGVAKNATKHEIKKAYIKKAKQWHPDVCKDKKASEMMKEINEAYSILSDDKKRKEYDSYNNW